MNTIITIFLLLIPIFFLLTRRKRSSERLPLGSLGLPLIGQSFGLLRAMRANTAEEWLQKTIRKYGPIQKMRLFGKPAVFVCGQAANKFVFTTDSSTLVNQQVKSTSSILGDPCIMELVGEDHKQVRDSLVSFLKPESLKEYIGKMDEEVRKHLEIHWHGKQQVTVSPLMKTLTFNIICTLLFGVERGARRDKLAVDFQSMIGGLWSVPVNLPFTRYNRGLQASARVQKMLKGLVGEKRVDLEQKGASPRQDLITCLLSIRKEKNEQVISEKEIIHNVMLIMVAGHDTSSILLTFLVRLLAKEPSIHAAVLQEQEEIAKSKPHGEMKYTWKVAMETLRMFPPVFAGFRKAVKDIEFGGYVIPKDWQVLWVPPMTQMDDSIFPGPSKFDPTRFENQASIPPYCYIPFGGGPRMCPGYEFARIETPCINSLSGYSVHLEVAIFRQLFLQGSNAYSS